MGSIGGVVTRAGGDVCCVVDVRCVVDAHCVVDVCCVVYVYFVVDVCCVADVRCVVDVYFVVDDCQPCHRGVIFSQCRVTLLIVLLFGMGLLGVHHCGHCITTVGFYSMFITVATVSQ